MKKNPVTTQSCLLALCGMLFAVSVYAGNGAQDETQWVKTFDLTNTIEQLELDSADNLVARANYTIRTFSQAGKLIRSFPLDMSRFYNGSTSRYSAKQMAIDEQDRVYLVMDYEGYYNPAEERNFIQVWNSDGSSNSVVIGTSGTNSGQYADPYGIAVSHTADRIYVSDLQRRMILVYQKDGTYLYEFTTSGYLAATLEQYPETLFLGTNPRTGAEELFVYDKKILKVFAVDGTFIRHITNVTGRGGNNLSFGFHKGQLYVMANYSDLRFFDYFSSNLYGGSGWTKTLSLEYGSYLAAITDNGQVFARYYNNSRYCNHYTLTYRTLNAPERNAVPVPAVVSVLQRPQTTYMDILYRVEDPDDATVATAVYAKAGGDDGLDKLIPMTLIEGTASNVGAGMAVGVQHQLTWDVSQDWSEDYGDVRIKLLAMDSRQHLLDVHFIDMPASGTNSAMTISRTPLDQYDFMPAWYWLAATQDASINFANGEVRGVSGVYSGELLASETTTTALGRQFLFEREGWRQASFEEIQRAREGATPGYVIKDAVSKYAKVEGLPQNANEYGFDSYDYYGYDRYGYPITNLDTYFWVIDEN